MFSERKTVAFPGFIYKNSSYFWLHDGSIFMGIISNIHSMKTFKETLGLPAPDKNLSPVLKSLWYDAKGDWTQAHAQVDHLRDLDSAWVHAYLHRKEGDLWNADYWYARAKKIRPSCSLQEEWENLVLHFYS